MYIGRFAPSPTGPLHFGSLLTAIASYADAKAHNGKWLLRIDDIDHQRSKGEYIERILYQLEAYQLLAEDVVYQSDRTAQYAQALVALQATGQSYLCQCSRQQLSGHKIYPQHCYQQALSGTNLNTRLHIPTGTTVHFIDHIQGAYQQTIDQSEGDIVLKRREGIYNYPLAVVVDDHIDHISHVVRGADLLAHSPMQIWLSEQLFGKSVAHYAHIPLAMRDQTQKLSKQNLAKPIATSTLEVQTNLQQAASALGQPRLSIDSPHRMLTQLVDQWSLSNVPTGFLLPGTYA